MTSGSPSTMFVRLGGREGVKSLVAAFYRRVAGDAELRRLYPADLRPGEVKLGLFLEQWLGGEPEYTKRWGHPRLRLRHFPFVIDEAGAERWITHMDAAMREVGVEPADAAVVLERLRPLAFHMVNANEDVPREPLKQTFLT